LGLSRSKRGGGGGGGGFALPYQKDGGANISNISSHAQKAGSWYLLEAILKLSDENPRHDWNLPGHQLL